MDAMPVLVRGPARRRLWVAMAWGMAVCAGMGVVQAQEATTPEAPQAEPGAGHAEPDTLVREVDPIVLEGAQVPVLVGMPLDRLGCFAVHDGTWAPVPCQVDERTSDGAYVFTAGPEANPGDGDGRLSANDEWVLEAGDAGERVVNPPWGEGFKRGVEVALTDPLDGGHAWFYLGAYEQPPPRSSRDYVRYHAGGQRVEGTSYVLGFSSRAPIVFNTLILKKAYGGTGHDIVDRMKIRLTAKIWDTIDIEKTEEDYTSDLMGYIDGPVRVIRRTRNRLVLFWKIPSPSAVQDNYFYGTFFEFPVTVTLPLDMDTFLSECVLRISVDGNGPDGVWFYNSRNASPVSMDGKWSEAEATLDTRPAAWSVTFWKGGGHTGGWVNRLTIVSNVDLHPDLFYVDKASEPDPPENFPGQIGNVGYIVPDLKGLTRGTHVLSSVLYTFPAYAPGIEKRYMAVKDAPIRVTISRTF